MYQVRVTKEKLEKVAERVEKNLSKLSQHPRELLDDIEFGNAKLLSIPDPYNLKIAGNMDAVSMHLTFLANDAVALSGVVDAFPKVVKLLSAKNSDYSDAWQQYGIFTPLVRINDKVFRVSNLWDKEQEAKVDESVRDNLLDIVGYCLLAILWIEGYQGQFGGNHVTKVQS